MSGRQFVFSSKLLFLYASYYLPCLLDGIIICIGWTLLPKNNAIHFIGSRAPQLEQLKNERAALRFQLEAIIYLCVVLFSFFIRRYHDMLAFTRYCFTSRLLGTNQASFYCPSHLHCLRYCNTVARPLRNMRPPHRPPLCMPYTIQYWQWQYRVKAKTICMCVYVYVYTNALWMLDIQVAPTWAINEWTGGASLSAI